MGSVWEAEHVGLEVRVALKLLRAELGQDEAHIERFRREARVAAKLKSPHIVAIHDTGVERGTPYIAMEFLEGEDLELRLGRLGKLDPSEALKWLDQAARGLAAAHRAGLVHRDVKPANLFIERLPAGERLKVVDFGIARPASSESALTTQGGVWGSPAYMSPEQARGRSVDQRTDVWALAGVFYRMLTGQVPFPGRTEHDTIVEVCTGQLRPPSEVNPALPQALDELFVRALAKDPAERTATVEDLAHEAAEAIGESLTPFDLTESRTSAPSWPDTPRLSDPSPLRGRVTETKPIGGDTGPTGITTPSSPSEAFGERRFRGGLLALGALLGVGVLFALGRPSAPMTQSPPIGNKPEPPRAAASPSPTPTPTVNPVATTPPDAKPQPSVSEKQPPSRPKAKSPPRQTAPLAEPPPPPPPRPAQTDPLFGLPLEGDGKK
jgi:serine/threonine-protein kinase